MKRHGPWTIHETREVYRDPWIELTHDEVTRPDGKPGSHCILRLKPGVCVLPIDDDGHVFLTDEFHYAIGRNAIEGVSGGIEADEDPLETARRELREEIGLVAQEWHDLGVTDPFTTIVHSPTRLYVARKLSHVPTEQEGTEQIERVRMPFEEALRRVLASEITHAPTCVVVLKAKIAGLA